MKENSVKKKIWYSLFSNIISTILSILVILVLPKLVSISDYGHWQLYLFYVSYVGIFHCGWVDGIYLRFGGKKIDSLRDGKFKYQFFLFVIFETIIVIILLFIFNSSMSSIKEYIIFFAIINILIMNLKSLLMFTLQSISFIKEYSMMVLVDRLLFLIFFIFLILSKNISILNLLIIDVFSKFISIVVGVYYLKELFDDSRKLNKTDFLEVYKNITTGVKLLISYLSSIFIVGVIRLSIEKNWGIESFAKVSLTLSISNFLMVLINAVGVVMYPMIRNIKDEKLPEVYTTLRDVLMVILLAFLLGYYPMRLILGYWLPGYEESLKYMAILFPMCLYEGKMYLLINTYLKALRKEKILMYINIFSLFLSILLSFFTTYVLDSLNLTVVLILFILSLRCLLSEMYLLKLMKFESFTDIHYELILTLIFIGTSWFLNIFLGFFIYFTCYFIYLLMKKNALKKSIPNFKILLNKRD